ncbi:hypothetical protein QJS10_CPA08g01777 [Acorus calamus]|uniref:Uncharacterized protein n=1 Tax=Acorus calamus TaxID=4465 RepID=A0AAV9ECI9_ACOCL|nr:hypothetical protein QJS10_CPA08g01777 [Acorus calamus]
MAVGYSISLNSVFPSNTTLILQPITSAQQPNQPAQTPLTRPAHLHRPPCSPAHLLHPLRHDPPLLPHHKLPHHPLYLLCLHEPPTLLPIPRAHAQPDPQFVHHQPRVHELLRHHRPRHQRHARAHALQHRVPSAVAHEPSHTLVFEHAHLVHPLPHDQPPIAHARLEPGEVRHGLPHDPHEVHARVLQPVRERAQLGLRHLRLGPERHVQHRALLLPLHVQPARPVARSAFSGRPGDAERADVVHRRAELLVPVVNIARLELVKAVDDDTTTRRGFNRAPDNEVVQRARRVGVIERRAEVGFREGHVRERTAQRERLVVGPDERVGPIDGHDARGHYREVAHPEKLEAGHAAGGSRTMRPAEEGVRDHEADVRALEEARELALEVGLEEAGRFDEGEEEGHEGELVGAFDAGWEAIDVGREGELDEFGLRGGEGGAYGGGVERGSEDGDGEVVVGVEEVS